jgi:hypothetical protein
MTPRRYGPLAYVPITRRPKLTWPGGARVALWVNPNIEFFGLDLRRQFDTLYREGETIPRVMAIAVHPFVTGQPHRIGALDAGLEYICSHAGVWRATGWEIVQHFLAQQSK